MIAVSTMNIVRREVLTCVMKSRMETLRVVDGLLTLQRPIELNLIWISKVSTRLSRGCDCCVREFQRDVICGNRVLNEFR